MNDWMVTSVSETKKRSKSGVATENKFTALRKNLTVEPARVSMSVSQSMEYGSAKVSATVTLCCDQNELTINQAGELAFVKACELLKDGWDYLGLEEGSG